MPSIVVDAGPFIALFRRSDQHHEAALEFLSRNDAAKLVTHMLVIGEINLMLALNHDAVFECLNWLFANVEIDRDAGSDLTTSIDVIETYRDLPADLADASLVALCERLGTNLVASIDQHFEVYRLPKKRRFKNVFCKRLGKRARTLSELSYLNLASKNPMPPPRTDNFCC